LVDGTSTVVVNTVELDAIGVFEILAAAALLDVAAPQSVASASQRINAESALLVETQPELSSDGSVSINVVVGSFVDAPSIESTWASSIGATSSLVVTAPTILVDTRFIYDPCTIPIGLMSLCGVSVGVDASDIVVALEVDSLGDVSVEVVGIVASVPMLAASLVGVGISMEVQS
jgi:hypothetical protein